MIRLQQLTSLVLKKMNYLSVYTEKNSSSLNVKLLFILNDRKFTMSRLAAEPVGKTLRRIGISVQKANVKRHDDVKKKSKQQEVIDNIPVVLLSPNGENIDGELTNEQAWKEPNVLKIGELEFIVEENTPIVHSAKIPSIIMAGFPVVPTVKLEFASKDNSQFKWFKKVDEIKSSAMQSEVESVTENENIWTEVGEDFIYIPSINDIGSVLKMTCKAGNGEKVAHEWFNVIGISEIAAGPGLTPFDTRHLYTSKPTSNNSLFRVVSYNILADCYLEDEEICDSWFGYCPKYALAIDYRQQLLLKEIVGYNGDVVCLQECGRRLYDNYLNPVMTSQGFAGLVKYKSGVMPEGEAIFFKKSKFALISEHNFELKEALLNESCNNELLEKVKTVPEVYDKLITRTTVAQFAILQSVENPKDYICVVNTHLYFRPSTPFIRNLQTIIVLNMLKKTIDIFDQEMKEKHVGDVYRTGVLFCGDFNSLPQSGVVQLLSDGVLPNYHQDWNLPAQPEQTTSRLEMFSYQHKFDFQNCCGFPEFTTYTEGFSGVIDYIFASKKCFEVKSVIPVPSKDEVQLYTAIPSPVMPSDHIALVCELKWT